MNMNTALQELGAHENLLSDKEKTELDENGFTLFHDMISKDELQEFRERFEFLIEKEGKHAGCELGKKNLQPSRLLANVCNKGEIYDKVYTNPRLLAAIHYVLKDDFNTDINYYAYCLCNHNTICSNITRNASPLY